MAKKENYINNELFVCQCENTEHQVIFTYLLDSNDVYMQVHLVHIPNIFKRIWNAVKYVFGYKSKYGCFDEFIFKNEDLWKLKKIIDIVEKD